MFGVKVPISSGLDTKDDLYTSKGDPERGNLSVGPIDDACNKLVFTTPENTKLREKGRFSMNTRL